MKASLVSLLALLILSLSGCVACGGRTLERDAGSSIDAGSEPEDGGFDAGADDAGFDAGPDDAGFDAGEPEPEPVCVDGSDEVEPEPIPDVLVTTLEDVVDADDGVLSLREALDQLASGEIPDGSVIGFDPSLSGNLLLSNGLRVLKSVTLLGHDENGDGEPDIWLERDIGAPLLTFDPAASDVLRVRWLGFTGGTQQLVLLSGPDAEYLEVLVERCSFANTTQVGAAAGIARINGSSPFSTRLVVRESTFRDTHRGVYFSSFGQVPHTVLIEDSVFEGALGTNAILLEGVAQATILNTVITTPTSDAAIRFRSTQDARLVNTTVATSGPSPRLRHRESTIHLQNTVLTGEGRDCAIDTSGSDVIAHHSFIGATDGCTFDGDNNITGTLESPADPRLLPFGDYGGPRKSVPPAEDSPLIDSGDDALAVHRQGAPLLDDGRGPGFPRRCDGDGDGSYTVDMGAAEFMPAE